MKKITLYIITFIFLFGCKQNNSDRSDTEIALIPAIPLNDKSMNTLSDDDVKGWKSDLAYLRSKILELHPNPFFSGNESEFNGILIFWVRIAQAQPAGQLTILLRWPWRRAMGSSMSTCIRTSTRRVK